VRSSNAIVSCGSNGAVCSYLAALRNIAINFKMLNSANSATSARLKKAAILVGFQRVRKRNADTATDPVDSYEEDWDLKCTLLAPNQVVIADDTIALQQFGEGIFCAPQEDILEGKYGYVFP